MIFEASKGEDARDKPAKRKGGRPRTRPVKQYLSPGEVEAVDKFLSVRFEQAQAAADAFRAGMPDRAGVWSESQLCYLRRVASTIQYLQSTLADPIGWELPAAEGK
jgi:hypothetical protein